MFEINYSQLIQYEVLEKLVTFSAENNHFDLLFLVAEICPACKTGQSS